MNNPLRPQTYGHRQVTCQIVHIERAKNRMLIDLITLEPCVDRAAGRMPPGTPLTLQFSFDALSENGPASVALLRRWEQAAAILALAVDRHPAGLRYGLSAGDEQLMLIVDDAAGGRA